MNVLDIFYNSIILEATTGAIDCFMYYHICFNTSVNGQLFNEGNPKCIDVPLLEINNKREFDILLKEYVDLALEFYDDSYFYDEVLSGEYRTDKNKLCKEKVLMTLLWANATSEDFHDPCRFLIRQKAYLANNPLTEEENKGTSNILGNVVTKVVKTSKLSLESPFAFRSALTLEDEIYDLPTIHFGIDDDTVYIYSIHQSKKARKSKKINRRLYKVNENFDPSINNDLKDITPSSLVALALFMLHCQNMGISKGKLVPYLPERWIDKQIMICKNVDKQERKSIFYKEKIDEILRIQNNLTQKFLTTFLRLNYHYYNGMDILGYPYEQDAYLSFSIDDLTNGNNELFQELANMYFEQKKTK